MTISHRMPSANVRPKPFARGPRQEEQRQRRYERDQVGVDRRQDTVAHAGDGCGTNAAAHANFFAEALERQNGRVGRHTDGKHDAGNARKRKREQPEMRKRSENAEVQRREHRHSSGGNQAEAMIEQQQIQHDERKADPRNHNARCKAS